MPRKQSAFTLVELMVSTSILTLMMVILLQMTGQTANTWRYGAAKAEQFQEARKAFETVTRRVSEATLNTYWDYYRPATKVVGQIGQNIPTDYVRQSDLRFRVVQMSSFSATTYHPTHGIFFQAQIGEVENKETVLTYLDNLINSWGYFLEVSNTTNLPGFLAAGAPTRTRCRLMEFRQPSEEFDLYSKLHEQIKSAEINPVGDKDDVPPRDPVIQPDGRVTGDDEWFKTPLALAPGAAKRPVTVLAENIIALVILPRLSPADERVRNDPKSKVDPKRVLLTPNYEYHSKQLSNYYTGSVNGISYNKSNIDPEINPKNQLPPVVQIAMFALDEASAQRLAILKASTTDLGLADMLKKNGKPMFTDANVLETDETATPGSLGKSGDLGAFEQKLVDLHLSYRLFSSNVAIRGAKWSRAQIK